MIIYVDDSAQVEWPDTDLHDINSKKVYAITYRPALWTPSTARVKSGDVVIATTFNGCMYECISGGITGATEPVWGTSEGGATTDGDVKWKCLPYSAKLQVGDVLTASTWSAPSWVTIDNDTTITDGRITLARVTAVTAPANTSSFTLINHITITRVSGIVEEFDKSLIIGIGIT